MPIEIGSPAELEELTVEEEEVEIDALLIDENGELTIEGQVIYDFLNFVDWDEVFEDDTVAEHITSTKAWATFDESGNYTLVDKGTEGAEEVQLQELSGESVAQVVDEDDLLAMFQYFVECLPDDTLEDKARKAVFEAYDDELGEAGKVPPQFLAHMKKKKKGMKYERMENEEGDVIFVDENGMAYSQSDYQKKYGKKGGMMRKAGKKDKMMKYEDEDGNVAFLDERGSVHGMKFGSKHGKKKKPMMKYENDVADAPKGDKAHGRDSASQDHMESEDGIDEGPFKKGSFRKIHKAGGKDQVARMILAMLGKEAIQRVSSGAGYRKGDYKKHGAGYGGGTAKGRKKYQLYRSKFAGKIAKAAKKAKKGKRIAARFSAKAKVKKGAASPAKKGKKKKTLAASAPQSPSTLTEGSRLAAGVLSTMKTKPIVEKADPAKTDD